MCQPRWSSHVSQNSPQAHAGEKTGPHRPSLSLTHDASCVGPLGAPQGYLAHVPLRMHLSMGLLDVLPCSLLSFFRSLHEGQPSPTTFLACPPQGSPLHPSMLFSFFAFLPSQNVSLADMVHIYSLPRSGQENGTSMRVRLWLVHYFIPRASKRA